MIDYVWPCIEDEIDESYILNFDEYIVSEAVEPEPEEVDDDEEEEPKPKHSKENKKRKYILDFNNINKNQANDLTELYSDKKLATVALEVIGKKLLEDNTFVKNADDIVNLIIQCLTSEKKRIKLSLITYNVLSDGVNKLKDLRSHDYVNVEEDSSKKSEK